MTEQQWSDVLIKATRLEGLVEQAARETQEIQQLTAAL